ncbi:MAG: lipid A biosynthesis acyltransferase, partial [Gammaproteobacteria bacterium]
TPWWLGIALSGPLGAVLRRLAGRRRRIAERNLERCFPDWSAADRAALLSAHFRALGRTLFETCWAWSAGDRRFRRVVRVEGAEHLDTARAAGKGIMILTAHVTCLEMGGRITALAAPETNAVYRPLRSPVLEWYQNSSRSAYLSGLISKRDLRGIVRALRANEAIWYAPDQDFGPDRSVFAPFFGIETASLEATVRLAQMSGCAVVPMYAAFDAARRRWTVRFDPPLGDFPSGDTRADLARINRIFEEKIRRVPEQYWWIHRRFKTRPEGEPPFYD